jgi:hypothetical protein
MCIIIGKYFDNFGWVGVKNRDRNYIPEISFKKKHHNGIEILYFWDNITQYCEGMNSQGIAVLSASLMVLDDEKEITQRAKTPSRDGIKIKNALKHNSIKQVVYDLVKNKLTGNTIVFDQETMYLIEGAWERLNERKNFKFVVKKISPNDVVVRTNHGVWLPWAGYQRDQDTAQTISRVSSESRRLCAQQVTHRAENPEDIIDRLTVNFTDNPQLNPLRTTHDKKKMRTTSQILIIPRERTMYVRPVQSHMKFNFWELNRPEQRTWVEIMSNRVLYMNLKDQDPTNDPPFADNLNHSTGNK